MYAVCRRHDGRVHSTSFCGKDVLKGFMVWGYWFHKFMDKAVEVKHTSEHLMVKLVIGNCLDVISGYAPQVG